MLKPTNQTAERQTDKQGSGRQSLSEMMKEEKSLPTVISISKI